MRRTVELIAGDTQGVSYAFPVFHFDGREDAPSAYLQAALHGGELPGVVAIDALMPMLRKADDEGRIRGRITIVPSANPIGRSQYQAGELMGRFHFGTQTNFNREFPLLASPDEDPEATLDNATADQRLKARLLKLSMGHDIVLDLHCDDESLAYLYVPTVLWPSMQDCSSAMNMEAVILWDGDCGAAFDQASIDPYISGPAALARFDRRVVSTVEYRGMTDVDPSLAREDAKGLYRLLVTRGVVADPGVPASSPFQGVAAPVEHVEMIRAPRAGALLYHVRPGDRVEQGARLVTIVHAPGDPDGRLDVLAPQGGLILTRRNHRAAFAGDDLIKLIGSRPSATHRPGALED
ncbi:MAG: succinylglutamate desuccinylase/aspartoacylase family protein [Rhizobiaceae bacterium]|nr:succinylglutamate desuccinylase/aspartoacylase family protein [Rhizobiaceae bacterium]